MKENIQLSDLTVVGTLADTVLLCVMNEDAHNSDALAIQYDLGMGTFYIDNIQKFLKFTPFDPVEFENKNIQKFYRDWIYRHLSNDVCIDSLVKFANNEVNDELQKAYLLGIIDESTIEKAWQKHAVGSVVTRKDGKKYRKNSDTGDSAKDWVLAEKEKDQDQKLGEDDDEEEVDHDGATIKPSKKKLGEHAVSASESTLINASKNSSDPDIRTIANIELKRREEEEHPKEKEEEKPIKKGYEQWL